MNTPEPNDSRLRLLARLERLDSGSTKPSDMDAFKRELRSSPALLAELADLTGQVQRHLLARLPDDPFVAESIRQAVAHGAGQMGELHDSPLEQLLLGNMLTCWARLYLAEREYTARMAASPSRADADDAERRLSAAQLRWLRALNSLAHVHRLMQPPANHFSRYQQLRARRRDT